MVTLYVLKLQSKSPSQIAWFFDFDGSLCPHLEVWESPVYNSPDIYDSLLTLKQKGSSIFWNTGRRPESLGSVHPKFLSFDGYFVHGSVFWDSKKQASQLLGPAVSGALARFYEDAISNDSRYRLEVKPTSLRIAPFTQEAFVNLEDVLKKYPLPVSEQAVWRWVMATRAAELLAKNVDKGSAVEHAMKHLPGKVPVAIGDDLLDRPAVEAALRLGGFAILVGEHCGWVTEIPHQNSQVIFQSSPDGVLELLTRLG